MGQEKTRTKRSPPLTQEGRGRTPEAEREKHREDQGLPSPTWLGSITAQRPLDNTYQVWSAFLFLAFNLDTSERGSVTRSLGQEIALSVIRLVMFRLSGISGCPKLFSTAVSR